MLKWILRLTVVIWSINTLGVLGSMLSYDLAPDAHLFIMVAFALIALFYYSRVRATNIMRDNILDRSVLGSVMMYEGIGAFGGFFMGLFALTGIYHRLFVESLPLFG